MGRYGLQVLGRGGRWIDVPAIQGELTILLGDYLQWLSGGETVIAVLSYQGQGWGEATISQWLPGGDAVIAYPPRATAPPLTLTPTPNP